MRRASLPKFLHHYFWDIDASKLDPQKKPDYVIQRLLEMGDTRAIRWIRKNFPKSQIKQVVSERRGFSPKTAGLWSLLLGIPSQKVRCLQKPYRHQHAIHWPF